MRRVHQLKQGSQRWLRRPLVGPDHHRGGEEVQGVAFRHPSREHPIEILDGEQIHVVIPLVAGQQRIRGVLGAAAIRREPIGGHLGEQLLDVRWQALSLAGTGTC
jgi:hypothetical protein